MLTYSEGIVGLWLVPVVLCILVPLAMLCVWSVVRVFRNTGREIKQIEKSAKETRDELYVESLQSQTTA